MLNLEQAIELATKAHEGQWRRPTLLNYAQLEKLIGGSYECDLQSGCFTNNVYKHNNKLITKIDDDSYYYSKPYITHPLAVMEMMDTEEEKIVAVLHDVFEDTEVKLHSNRTKGFNCTEFNNVFYEITDIMWCTLYILTKKNTDWSKFKEKGEYQSYQSYINDISKNKLATKVKIADIVGNLADTPSEHAKQKYLQALPILLKGI